MVSPSQQSDLLAAALRVRMNAHAPYSNFLVGAAVLCRDGQIHAGCNVENIAYPEGTCAEAGAIAGMCAAGGSREIVAALVVADCSPPVTPCGGCRQKLAEFGSPQTELLFANLDGVQLETTLADTLPGAFSSEHFGQKT